MIVADVELPQLCSLRIDKAIQLIDQPEHSLLNIAYQTGFTDQSHFTRLFKTFVGKSSSAYRKEGQKGKESAKV